MWITQHMEAISIWNQMEYSKHLKMLRIQFITV